LLDFELVDERRTGCNRADLDRIFIAVDAKQSQIASAKAEARAKAGKKAEAITDEKKALLRVEFFAALVQVALAKFVQTGEASNLAEGLHMLLVGWIDPRINYDILPDPNLFRRSCYIQAVSAELARHETSLRALHSALSEIEFGAYATRLGCKTWLAFLRAINFIVGLDLSERDCNLCFVWSRMASTASKNDALPFEGFLEALCRISSIKALPTDGEIAARGCENAGRYVLLMYTTEALRKEYEQMLAERTVGWGGGPQQPLERCVAHVLSIVVHAVEAEVFTGRSEKSIAEKDGTLSSSEIATWIKRVGLKS